MRPLIIASARDIVFPYAQFNKLSYNTGHVKGKATRIINQLKSNPEQAKNELNYIKNQDFRNAVIEHIRNTAPNLTQALDNIVSTAPISEPANAPQEQPLPAKHVYEGWKRSLKGGNNPRTGKPLNDKEKTLLQQKITDYEQRASQEQPSSAQQPTPATQPESDMPPIDNALADDIAANQKLRQDQQLGKSILSDDMDQQQHLIDDTKDQMQATPPAPPVAQETIQGLQNGPAMATNASELAKMLQQATSNFARSHNAQVQAYNPAINLILQATKSLQSNPAATYTPQIMTQANSLVELLNKAAQDDQQDAQLLAQISNAAKQLAPLIGRGMPSPAQQNRQPAATPQQATPQAPNANNRGWGAGIGDFVGNVANIPRNIGNAFQRSRGADSNQRVLTAEISSAANLI